MRKLKNKKEERLPKGVLFCNVCLVLWIVNIKIILY